MTLDSSAESIILLVDDNPTNLSLLFDALGGSGFKILIAQDGESAIEQVKYIKPNLILLDVMMPGMDGFTTCRCLKENEDTKDIPIIFMTALAETVDKVKGLSLGAVDYITKPIQPEEVLCRVHIHLAIQNLQKQLQEQNIQLKQEIHERRKAEEATRILLHAVSHDLRNPVNGMLMVLNNLQNSPEDIIPIPRFILQRMAQSSERQLSLINSLLETHLNDIQGVVCTFKPLQLNALVQAAITDLEPILTKNQALLKNLVPEDLPLVNADAAQLWRVLINLISNALNHNPPGLNLSISATVEPKMIRCSVQDDGVGMSAEQCERLFDLYFQGSQARQSLSLGLGLYLCRQIISAHGGEIGVKSAPKDGATFWFTLPLYNYFPGRE